VKSMDILVTYDVNTEDRAGQRRLRRTARACLNYGQRVQYSVFECSVNETQLERLRGRLLEIVDLSRDSLRIYFLRGKREEVVEAYGRDLYIDFDDPLVV
jgi:CRISPR-associated protein Cas2